jgi:hypothetical protein
MVSIFHTMYYEDFPIIQTSMIYIDLYQEHELAHIIKYTFIIVSRAPIPTPLAAAGGRRRAKPARRWRRRDLSSRLAGSRWSSSHAAEGRLGPRRPASRRRAEPRGGAPRTWWSGLRRRSWGQGWGPVPARLAMAMAASPVRSDLELAATPRVMSARSIGI